MALFTPAPWTIDKKQIVEFKITIGSDSGKWVASVETDDLLIASEEEYANALLVKSAPDLLNACVWANQEFEELTGHPSSVLTEAIISAIGKENYTEGE